MSQAQPFAPESTERPAGSPTPEHAAPLFYYCHRCLAKGRELHYNSYSSYKCELFSDSDEEPGDPARPVIDHVGPGNNSSVELDESELDLDSSSSPSPSPSSSDLSQSDFDLDRGVARVGEGRDPCQSRVASRSGTAERAGSARLARLTAHAGSAGHDRSKGDARLTLVDDEQSGVLEIEAEPEYEGTVMISNHL